MAQSEGSKGYSDTQKNWCLNFVHLAILPRQPNVGTGMSLLGGTFTILVSLLLCWTFLLWITHLVLHVTMNHPAYVGNIFAMPAEKWTGVKPYQSGETVQLKAQILCFPGSNPPTVPPPTVLQSQAANLCWFSHQILWVCLRIGHP